MQFIIPIEAIQLDESKSFLEILSYKNPMDCAVGEPKRSHIVLDSDSKPTMQEAYMAAYAAVHGSSYPETFDFFARSGLNQFIHERSKTLVKCFSPRPCADDKDMRMANIQMAYSAISLQNVKDYFYRMMLSNVNNHDLDRV